MRNSELEEFVRVSGRIESLLQQFKERISIAGECWLWTGTRTPKGYGMLYCGPMGSIGAHVFSLAVYKGIFLETGEEACHNCPGGDNPSCVNPDHLWKGTRLDNVIDMFNKGRGPDGERNGIHKLTNEQVSEIRKIYADRTCDELAEQFNISRSEICKVAKFTQWRPRIGNLASLPSWREGSLHHSNKLTNDQVMQIRAKAPSTTRKALAVEFGVNTSTIQKIVHRKIWKHV